jgi:eukaryotic-like serine/threonine-protein kinase
LSPEVAALERSERLLEAAALASQQGDHDSAKRLYERACAFGPAAHEALLAGDPATAMSFAAEAGDQRLAEEALAALEGHGALRERVALTLETRGHAIWAARLYEAAGKARDAARAYDKAGDAIRAARLLESCQDVVAAAKVLEGAMRRSPDRFALHVAYGALLLRYGKPDHATRALQKVPPQSKERRLALTWLVRGLRELGYSQAEAEAKHELDRLGGPADVTTDEGRPQTAVKARLFGRYEVLREVASSPSARVVECMDTVRTEHVAVKIFAGYDARGAGRDALARFEREVRVLGALDHPNVLPLRDYLPEGPALVLAWMTGGTLDGMLRKEPIAPARAVEIAVAVLLALGEAHRVGVLHRDVKPANVLFDDAGVTRLGDFGAAHLGDLSATATAGLIGTLAYMSPEQREGRPATVKSDLYGVGAILWEMLTGERPTFGADDEAPPSTTQPASAYRARPSGVHRDLDIRHDAVVLRLLAADPEKRPADAFAARRELTAMKWPSTVERTPLKKASEFPRPELRGTSRLEARLDGILVDTWTSRPVECVPLDPVTLGRAKILARLEHPMLQPILRVDREGGTIWLGNPDAPRVSRPLGPEDAARLRDALAALHAEGLVHGHVDASNLRELPDGSLMLRFSPNQGPTGTVDNDRIALARLLTGA